MSTFLSDYIRVYQGTIPPDLCTELIRRFDSHPNVTEGKVGTENGPHDPNVRSCQELNISKQPEMKDVQAVLMNLGQLAVAKYTKDVPAHIFPEEIGIEQFRMKKYRAGTEDHFSYHVDVNNHPSARRFLVMFWYLNDVAKGGETFFPGPNIRIPPKQGQMLMFPPMWMYPHSGEKPESGDKYIIGTYLHYLG